MLRGTEQELLCEGLKMLGLKGEELTHIVKVLSQHMEKASDLGVKIAQQRKERDRQLLESIRIPLTEEQQALPTDGQDYYSGVGSGTHTSPRGWVARKQRSHTAEQSLSGTSTTTARVSRPREKTLPVMSSTHKHRPWFNQHFPNVQGRSETIFPPITAILFPPI